MTFKERYEQSKTWYEKVLVMNIYHTAMVARVSSWTITMTAQEFECSIGLVSENLRLADAIHSNDSILKCESRQDALKRLNGRYSGAKR